VQGQSLLGCLLPQQVEQASDLGHTVGNQAD
jgi:hypothetical protein